MLLSVSAPVATALPEARETRVSIMAKIVVEPTGALAFAGAQHGNVDIHGARVGILISGGNVDLSRLARFLAD